MKKLLLKEDLLIEKIVNETIAESQKLLRMFEEYDKSPIPLRAIIEHFKKTRIYRIIFKFKIVITAVYYFKLIQISKFYTLF